MANYIMIGDIHGQAKKLEQLLYRLGFAEVAGVYRPAHPGSEFGDTRLVFVGDFIDRGPDNQRVIEIVRRMMAEGQAMAVMGNHEFNAICYHTPTPAYRCVPIRIRIRHNTPVSWRNTHYLRRQHLRSSTGS